MPRPPDLTADVHVRQTIVAHLAEAKAPPERGLYQHALDTLDFNAVGDIQRRHLARADPENHSPIRRSFNAGRFLRRAFIFCQELDLVRSPPLAIFDISCGTGYFAYAARYFGHEVISLDKAYPVYLDMHRWLGNRFIGETVLAGQPLPETPRVDLVTAFSAQFHAKSRSELFDAPDWDFFFADLVTNHLKPGGRMFLLINQVEGATSGMNVESPEFRQYVESRGGEMGKIKHSMRFDDLSRVPGEWRGTELADVDEAAGLRAEIATLKEIVADQALELHRLKGRDGRAPRRLVAARAREIGGDPEIPLA